jgi:hypothetical protein
MRMAAKDEIGVHTADFGAQRRVTDIRLQMALVKVTVRYRVRELKAKAIKR